MSEDLNPELFHIDAVNISTGRRERLTDYPMTRAECQTNISKLAPHKCRRLEMVPVSSTKGSHNDQ